jgi:DNA-binding response OmpR family regulator
MDDDKRYCDEVAAYLRLYGCETASITEPAALKAQVAAFQPDLLLLDQRLGVTTGTQVLQDLRTWSNIPCIVVTGMPDPTDRVLNLEVGADDEVDKSTPPRELLARVNAVLRRSATGTCQLQPSSSAGPMGSWTLCARQRELRRPDGSVCHLTTAEFETLLMLHAASGQSVRRAIICERVFARPFRPGERAVDTVIAKLRQKIEPEIGTRVIKTVRPLGYVFTGSPKVKD